MNYEDYVAKTCFSQEEVLAIAHGTLVDEPPVEMGSLPLPPLLMFDRVTRIEREGNRGRIVAELDVRLDAWYFQCHFKNDPVQPGCLGLDGAWQLIGLFLSTSRCPGAGRALGCRDIDFNGQIRPYNKLVQYDVEIRRLTRLPGTGCGLALADATVSVDGEPIYKITGARVGTFLDIKYSDYPKRTERSRGPLLTRERFPHG